MEAVILALVATIGACFCSRSSWPGPTGGDGRRASCRPLPEPGALFVAIGILGATVMPHNLYLHSALVQSRRIGNTPASKAPACRYNLIDSVVALNAALLRQRGDPGARRRRVLQGGPVQGRRDRGGLQAARPLLGHRLAPILFGVALLGAGQSSTLTGTLAGQIVMEGFLHLRIAPWLRRLVTRALALVPAVLVIVFFGEGATGNLLLLTAR